MKRFRLYCACKGGEVRQRIAGEVMNAFPAFTVLPALGVYGAIMEHSMVVEIITDNTNADIELLKISRWICSEFDQESVLLTCENIHSCEIGPSGILNVGGVDG